jgi:hypothetical protein
VTALRCSRCDEPREETDFTWQGHGRRSRRRVCTTCETEQKRLRYYNLDDTTFQAILFAQGNACAICEVPFGNEFFVCIDHSHQCCPGRRSCGKCVRGLLCPPCNKLLGNANDDIDILDSAIHYLRREESFL